MKRLTTSTLALVLIAVPLAAMAPSASANTGTACTPTNLPAGACVTYTLGSATLYYSDPSVGWQYWCSPFGVVCTHNYPEITGQQQSTQIPWLYTSISVWTPPIVCREPCVELQPVLLP